MEIIIYHSKSCVPCETHLKNFKKVAKKFGVKFELRDALEKPGESKRLGITSVPTTFIGGKKFKGTMTQKEIKKVLERYGE